MTSRSSRLASQRSGIASAPRSAPRRLPAIAPVLELARMGAGGRLGEAGVSPASIPPAFRRTPSLSPERSRS
jgi:hypothetical protein